MKETGIIMSGSHPVDILERRKTMTRRTWGLKEINEIPNAWEHFGFDQAGRFSFRWIGGDRILNVKCPYGQVGDRLWVRETFKYIDFDLRDIGELHPNVKVEYKSDNLQKWVKGDYKTQISIPVPPNEIWRPSIFLPRWASRILLEITEIRVERLQAITLVDCWDEGIRTTPAYNRIDAYHYLWDSLFAKRGYGWDKNNWVWPISFKILEGD